MLARYTDAQSDVSYLNYQLVAKTPHGCTLSAEQCLSLVKWLMLTICGQRVSPFADLFLSLEGASPLWRPLLWRKTSHPAYSSSAHAFTQAAVEPALEHDKEDAQSQSGGDIYWLGRVHRDRDRYRDTASSFSAKAFYVGKPKLTTGSMHLQRLEQYIGVQCPSETRP